MSTIEDVSLSDHHADSLRVEGLRLMGRHSEVADRGFDSARRRQFLHRQIDDLLDEYLILYGCP